MYIYILYYIYIYIYACLRGQLCLRSNGAPRHLSDADFASLRIVAVGTALQLTLNVLPRCLCVFGRVLCMFGSRLSVGLSQLLCARAVQTQSVGPDGTRHTNRCVSSHQLHGGITALLAAPPQLTPSGTVRPLLGQRSFSRSWRAVSGISSATRSSAMSWPQCFASVTSNTN